MSFWLDDDEDDDGNNNNIYSSGAGGSALVDAMNASADPLARDNSHRPTTMTNGAAAFICENCGGTESYPDAASGLEVCATCYTESQPSQSQLNTTAESGADWDDVMALAARTAGGRIKQQLSQSQSMGVPKSQQQRQYSSGSRYKQPLEELDQSVPLPNTDTCLAGMKYLLQKCVQIVVYDILEIPPPTTSSICTEADEEIGSGNKAAATTTTTWQQQQQKDLLYDTIVTTVRQVWMSYLQSWMDGAQWYGNLHPQVRFHFRDMFLSNIQIHQLQRQHFIQQYTSSSDGEMAVPSSSSSSNNNKRRQTSTSQSGKKRLKAEAKVFDDDDDAIDSADEDNDDDDNEIEDVVDDGEDDDNMDDGDHAIMEPVKVGFRRRRVYADGIRLQGIHQVLSMHCGTGAGKQRVGNKEAALFLRPSMTMVASILYVSLTKHANTEATFRFTTTVTPHDLCQWIRNGQLPLMNAFHHLLSSRLQQQLQPVCRFFRMDKPIMASDLERTATNLCVACQFRIRPQKRQQQQHSVVPTSDNKELSSVTKRNRRDVVRFWPVSSIPYILAKLVGRLGLNQTVLNRTLLLAGFSLVDPLVDRPQPESENMTTNGSDVADEIDLKATKIPTVIKNNEITRIEELVALIVIACQLDPQWREWTYGRHAIESAAVVIVPSPTTDIPWTESQFRELRNGPSFHRYLDHIEQHVYPSADNEATDGCMLPPEYWEAAQSLDHNDTGNTTDDDEATTRGDDDNIVRPCFITANACPPQEIEIPNMTFRRLNNGIGELYLRRQQSKVSGIVSKTSRNKATTATRRVSQGRDKRVPTYQVPMHDFYQADRIYLKNDYSLHSGGSEYYDPDEDQLIDLLSTTLNTNSCVVQECVHRILFEKKL